ncbi:MAG: polysaccharide deacetylase family protein [Calditrichaceae bacterium]|nr:polysaccharide deacetylase family protein [Calditrichaceae bacterium]
MNILTFDIEEWFHLLDNESTKTSYEWSRYESRINKNIDIIFKLLERTNTKATFFCLGWIVKKYTDVIRKITDSGYEIGSHTQMHQLIYEQTPVSFSNDLSCSIKSIEDLTGKKVKYFRAPGFSIREDNKWAFEIIAEHGIEIDCSVFPTFRAHGGLPSYKDPVPSIIKYNGIELKELPINYVSVLGQSIIYSGGGYFRMIPYPLIKKLTMKSDYVMSYLHPRDFDPDQPVIKELSLARRFKSYVGLKGAEKKLEKWLMDYDFIDINTADSIIDWKKVPIVKI